MLQSSLGKKGGGEQGPLEVSGGLSAVLGEWKGQNQHMACPGAHFKTGLKSISYGNALFTLIILYQVGVTSCSV